MPSEYSDAELLAYLDEQLSVERMAKIEQELRHTPDLANRLARLSAERDQGTHTVSEIWRRGRLSCPTRHQLGSFLLGTLSGAWADYVEFHLRTIGCRYCLANLTDLERSQEVPEQARQRRQKFFQSSAGFVRDAQRE